MKKDITLFTSTRPELKFIRLSECKEHLDTAAKWAKNAWGYMHLDDEQFHYKQLQELCEHVYIAMYDGLPVGMLAVFEKTISLEENMEASSTPDITEMKNAYLDYVYIDERARSMGLAGIMIEKAKSLAREMNAEVMSLETLSSTLNGLYKRKGGRLICESRYNDSYPTEVIRLKF
ncbi:GNAT family N-acetyltransferase [Legionella pneumophila]|uniref:Acyl-CoA N-acyltransferase n=1 Tax=Legionella pneumophila subsp. pascullei TaxID=91890 RepID=A0AAX2IZE5_LEGPN|nr:GNAT family N-acetyltransferase [Legionella pneumophila]AMP89011.1 GNAT family N-acetyltransferase [Legionella pneumophila subsp. pascullei]AMP93321.1 acyl-CoA acyltransferase [Legionella pneumophila subsp. pascullei]AMP96287.1 acyl-CoA acyltransferase [Legionella pneumophila subsp. pascullei]SQG91251.1 Acyl-CoA N-acyltransferase [Legionella pneumophila subsp. pascullei]VEH07797.1 Acyl-CoA N-acyltransferase [Legionella pneumophila subsp. pascullei]